VCEQLDEESWALTCRFLRHPEEQKSSKFCVRIPGFSRKLLPCQAHSVVRTLLIHNSPARSCFHGHAMGVGKTTIAIATNHIQHIVNLMRADVEASPRLHALLVDTSDTGCLSNSTVLDKYGLDCPCAEASPTYQIKASLGINLVLSPLGLLKTWCDEWRKCYSDDNGNITGASNPLHMALALGHRSAKAANSNDITVHKKGLMQSGEIPQRENEAPKCVPRLTNSQVTCVTTSQSFDSQVLKQFAREKTYIWRPQGEQKKNSRGETYTTTPRERRTLIPYIALVVASVWRDEAHLERLATSATINTLKSQFFGLDRHQGIHLNIMSGTLLTTGPTDIAHYIQCMARRSWRDHPVLRHWRKDEAIALGSEWDKLVKGGDVRAKESQAIIDRFKPLIEALVLRFTPDSNFLGTGPVVELPPCFYAEIKCKHPAEWNARLEQDKQEEDRRYEERERARRRDYLAKNGSNRNYVPLVHEGVTFHYRSRLYASFPFLMDISTREGEELKFTEAEWIDRRRAGQWKGVDEPYRKYIHEIARSSGKLAKIKEKIEEWDTIIDGEGLPARLIFCSYFFTGARIIYLVRDPTAPNAPLTSLRRGSS
jgi:hypothetical protein